MPCEDAVSDVSAKVRANRRDFRNCCRLSCATSRVRPREPAARAFDYQLTRRSFRPRFEHRVANQVRALPFVSLFFARRVLRLRVDRYLRRLGAEATSGVRRSYATRPTSTRCACCYASGHAGCRPGLLATVAATSLATAVLTGQIGGKLAATRRAPSRIRCGFALTATLVTRAVQLAARRATAFGGES